MVFALSQFGSGGLPYFYLFVLMAIIYVSALVVSGGRKLRREGTSEARRVGLVLVVLGSLIPSAVCYPPVRFAIDRVNHGNSPFGDIDVEKVHEGMTQDEVGAALGYAQDQHGEGDREVWYYWTDWCGLNCVCVRFERDGRVTSISGD
jgi:hypothetical protein